MTTMTEAKPYAVSEQLFDRAQQLMPGGVNSPVRAFKSVGGTPLFIEKANGPYIWDADGHQYIDFVGSWGPMILGHGFPRVIERIRELALSGTSFGAPTRLENQLAEVVIDAVPSIEMVRFVNSGTEAVMSAIRLARAATGRNKIIKFKGCYHGHTDALLVKAGSGAATLGVPDSAGVPASLVQNTLVADYNRIETVEALLAEHGPDVAVILVEPVAGNMGCVPPVEGFLQELRSLATKHGTLLVFDEVMTGFRVAYGGVQAKYNVTPDITCLGKIVGGGLPVGAYGASKAIMSQVAPVGPMYQAGTLSGNPLAMGAGLETLLELKEHPEYYLQLEKSTQAFCNGIQKLAAEKQIAIQTPNVCGMFSIFFSNNSKIETYDDVLACDKQQFNTFFHKSLSHGLYFAPSAFEAGFLGVQHTEELLAEVLQKLELCL